MVAVPAESVLQTSMPVATAELLCCNTTFPFIHLTTGVTTWPSGIEQFNAERGQSVGNYIIGRTRQTTVKLDKGDQNCESGFKNDSSPAVSDS